MTRTGRRKSARSTRRALSAPGTPPAGRREDRVQFWKAIARCLYPSAAVADARVCQTLHHAPSTISRGLRRNAGTRGGSLNGRATTARWHTDRAASRPKLALNARRRLCVQERRAGAITTPAGLPIHGPTGGVDGTQSGPLATPALAVGQAS